MNDNITAKAKTIVISPAAPITGVGLTILGAMLFGFGVGVAAPVPIIFGIGMLFLGLFILGGLLRENKGATHRAE